LFAKVTKFSSQNKVIILILGSQNVCLASQSSRHPFRRIKMRLIFLKRQWLRPLHFL